MAPQPSTAGTPSAATPSAAAPAGAPAPAAGADAASPLLPPLRSATNTLYNMMQQTYSHAGAPSTAALLTTSHALVAQLLELQRLSRAMQANAAPAPAPAPADGSGNGEGTVKEEDKEAAAAGPEEAPLRDVTLPPEVVAYVQDGRNPDIYTREFVELAMRNNQRLRGKADAFARFAGVLAAEMVGACPELRVHVERVLGEDVVLDDGRRADGARGPGPG
jgi:hypothetical protein